MAPPSILLLALFLPILFPGSQGSPPEPVVKCESGNTSCTVTNAVGMFPDRTTCHVASVAYPSNEHELLRVVSDSSSKKQHMKVVTAYSHSFPKLSCPGGSSGAGLVISTEHLNKVVTVDAVKMRMTVESGIKLKDFIDAAAEHGMALENSPYFLGVTLGGLLCTGAHGSSFIGKGGAVHEYVVGMRLVVPSRIMVDGYYARIVNLEEDDEDLLAAKVSLGVLGVISQLEPMYKRSISYRVTEDTDFEYSIASYSKTTHYGDIGWYPSQGKVVYRDDVKVPISVPGEGINDLLSSQPSSLVMAVRSAENQLEGDEDAKGRCQRAETEMKNLLAMGMGLKSKTGSIHNFTGYPVIGYQNDMQASGSCLNSPEDNLDTICVWDPRIPGLLTHVTALSIPFSDITSFITDVKKLRNMNPEALCGPELYDGGIRLRFVKNSTAYLGKTYDSVDIGLIYYRSHDPNQPRIYQDVIEEIEQMLVFKYNGLPHFGKNRPVGFVGVRNKLGMKGDKFVNVMERYDEEGLFSSDWSDAVLGLRGKVLMVTEKGCAVEGLCICYADEHCSPNKGYYCQPGLVYKEARVCRKTTRIACEEREGVLDSIL
ncbi:probable L-gulonolactone oxidase 4 isoform X2 [Asparagus officinalis]|uniref:probable L-gulonolactone oxidase 4 isoform X2 n=1 Tax=Asparagus officinalis TaxID=4686 RepID=UPI00098E86E7|nr:probable L-gulonolactone oxidase 4 isoform X2 [Asparagus officinalis]